MNDASRIRKIGLYGPFGWGNLGDASIQEAMIHNLRQRLPEVEFLGISLNPENTQKIHGIASVPISRHWRKAVAGSGAEASADPAAVVAADPPRTWKSRLKSLPVLGPALPRMRIAAEPLLEGLGELRDALRCRAALAEVDVFVVSGGGQLSDDWGGPWDHPFALLKWMLSARWAGARVVVMSVGAGPIRERTSGRLFRLAMRLAHYRSYRDVESHDYLESWGFTLRDEVYPDLAFSLPRQLGPADARSSLDRPVLGISPLSYCYPKAGPWPQQDRERYRVYLNTMTEFTSNMLEAGHPVALFSSQVRNDRHAFDELFEQLSGRSEIEGAGHLDAEPTRDLAHLLEQIRCVDVVVTSRLHGVILSYLHHKPVISLSYDPKIDAVMRHFGQSSYCLDIEDTTSQQLGACMEALVADLESIRAGIAETIDSNRRRLDEQYTHLFGPRNASRDSVADSTTDLQSSGVPLS